MLAYELYFYMKGVTGMEKNANQREYVFISQVFRSKIKSGKKNPGEKNPGNL